MVDGVLLAHAVVGAVAERQEVLGELLVLLARRTEPVWVELVGVRPALQRRGAEQAECAASKVAGSGPVLFASADETYWACGSAQAASQHVRAQQQKADSPACWLR